MPKQFLIICLFGVLATLGVVLSQKVEEFCQPDAGGEDLLKQAKTKLGLSARAYDPTLSRP